MINKVFKFFVFAVFLGFFSCKPVEYITVAEYSPTTQPTTNSFYYALPRTTLQVEVELVRTTKIPGPYYDYAERFLSIENALRSDSVSWGISGIKMNSASEADPNHYYVVQSSTNNISYNNLFQMSENGLIIDLSNQKSKLVTSDYIENPVDMGVAYKDLSVVENFGTVKDTLYRLVFRDTAFVKTPLIKYQVEQKSMEKKANEAALFIFELREKRFELITGNSESVPVGAAMKAALDEITRLENEYLSLFIGKTQTDTFIYTYDVIPEEGREISKTTLFRFSETDGALPENHLQGKPVIVEISKELSKSAINIPSTASEQNKVFYRAAEPAQIKVLIGNKMLASSKASVYQFGKILSLPITVTVTKKE